jgi:hypothetical protein
MTKRLKNGTYNTKPLGREGGNFLKGLAPRCDPAKDGVCTKNPGGCCPSWLDIPLGEGNEPVFSIKEANFRGFRSQAAYVFRSVRDKNAICARGSLRGVNPGDI